MTEALADIMKRERGQIARVIDPGEWLGPDPNAWGREPSLTKADLIIAHILRVVEQEPSSND